MRISDSAALALHEPWMWVMLLGAAPALLGFVVWLALPESPERLALRSCAKVEGATPAPVAEVFQPPLLQLTLLGIFLGPFRFWADGLQCNGWCRGPGKSPNGQDCRI
jgi:hypothetical protein